MVGNKHVAAVRDALARPVMTMRDAVDRDVVYVVEAQALIVEQTTHGLPAHHVVQGERRIITKVSTRSARRRPSVMFLSIEPLFFDGRHNLPVDHKRCTVVLAGSYGETEDDQALRPFPRAE